MKVKEIFETLQDDFQNIEKYWKSLKQATENKQTQWTSLKNIQNQWKIKETYTFVKEYFHKNPESKTGGAP